MPTYKDIVGHIRENEHFTAKTCWIAHVKADWGHTTKTAPNRQSPDRRVHPCPPGKRAAIEKALRHFGVSPKD
jgi:hypothetical protein